MLSVAEEHLVGMNPSARLVLSGQELNPESYAICKADMLIKGQDIKNIRFGNTLADDQLGEAKYDYMLSNPPFGVEWKKIQKEVQKEADSLGYAGRFGPGLPQVSDGSLLFLLHLISKMRPALEGGSRFGIALNGSPLFTGGAGSGESEIRRYVLENDLVEAIIGLPTDMFYNTGSRLTSVSGINSSTRRYSTPWPTRRPWLIAGAGSTTPSRPIQPSRGVCPWRQFNQLQHDHQISLGLDRSTGSSQAGIFGQIGRG
jgi:hypothetical protein